MNMRIRIAFFAVLIAGVVLLSGCNEKPAEKMEVIGSFSPEAGSQCGKYSVSSPAGEKYFADFNSDFVKSLAKGDTISVFGNVVSEGSCKKIIPETAKILERKGAIVKGALVSIDYIESIKDGNVFATSLPEIAKKAGIVKEKFEPLRFYAGNGQYVDFKGELLSEAAKAVIGLRKGEELTIEIPPEKGFGVYDPSKILAVNRNDWPLPRNVDPDIGTEVRGVFGTYAVVKAFDENFIYFDLNPKYAGKTLVFWLKVIDYNNETAGEFENIAEKGDTVKVDYTGRLADGNVFDSSIGKQPLQFTLGAGQMIKGFDNAVLGMKVGEEKTVIIPPELAYGERDERLVVDYNLSKIPGLPHIGSEATGEINGKKMTGRVTAISESTVTIDYNPMLAGESLNFTITLKELKKAQ